MKRFVAATALALALISGVVTTAQADNRDRNRHERHDDRNWDRNDNRQDRAWDRHDNRRNDRYDRRDWNRDSAFRHYDGRRYDGGRYYRPHGYYYRTWRYGDHLPRAYYARRYIVNDYYVYHLHRPPYGYHWVRVDNDIVLASIASGIVVSAVFGLFN